MGFNSIVNTVPVAATFNSAGTGKYVKSTVAFGGPTDLYQIAPARKVKGKTDVFTTSIMRFFETAPAVAGDPRPYCRMTVTIEVHKDVPLSAVDDALRQLDEFTSSANLTRIYNGEV